MTGRKRFITRIAAFAVALVLMVGFVGTVTAYGDYGYGGIIYPRPRSVVFDIDPCTIFPVDIATSSDYGYGGIIYPRPNP